VPDPFAIAIGLAVSFFAAGIVLAAAWRPWSRPPPPGAWTAAVALGAGYAAGHARVMATGGALAGWPSLPPIDAVDWLAWLAIAAAAAAGMDRILRRPRRGGGGQVATERPYAPLGWVGRLGTFAVAVLAPWLILKPALPRESPPVPEWTAVLLFLPLVLFVPFETLAARRPGPRLPLIFAIALLGTSASLLVSGSLRLAQLAGCLTAALGAALGISLWRRDFTLAGGGVVTGILGGLILAGRLYSELPFASAILLALSFLAAFLGDIGRYWLLERFVRSWRPRPRAASLASIAAAIVAAAGATAVAWSASPAFEPYDQ
jgi:hypothetical protein